MSRLRRYATYLPSALLLLGVAWNLVALGSGDLPLYLKRIWRNRDREAVDRSAALFLGSTGANYVEFLRESIPDEATVVLAPGYPTGHEGIMEYFLLPRSVQDCSAPYEQCAASLQTPDTYVLATRGYALAEPESLGYQWIPFPQANWEFQGFYAPQGRTVEAQPLAGAEAKDLLKEIALGLALTLGLGVIGIGVGSALVGAEDPWMTLACAFPLGAGAVTFSLFVLSWAGVRLNVGLLLGVLAVWIGATFVGGRRSILRWARAVPKSLGADALRWPGRHAPLVLGLIALLALSLVLAVGLSYYEDDELAIWSTKGYGMVLEGSVRAGETWGAHGLSYPLNIPLQIGLFRMAGADRLPISKLIFPLYYASLLLAAADFLRRQGVRGWQAMLAVTVLATVPLVQFHSTLALANLPLTVYLVLGSLLAVDAIDGGSQGRYTLSGLMLALGAWTRAEGMLYAGSLLVCFAVLGRVYGRERRRFLAGWVLPLVLVTGIWLAFALPSIASSHLGNAVEVFGEDLGAQRIGVQPLGTLLSAFSATALHKERWGSLLPVVGGLTLLALAFRRRDRGRRHEWLLVAGLLLAVEVVSVFFIRSYSRPDFAILVSRAIHRHLLPAFVLIYLGVAASALTMAWHSRKLGGQASPEP